MMNSNVEKFINFKTLEETARSVSEHWSGHKPLIGLILGSGWSQAFDQIHEIDSISYADLPALGSPSVVGHKGLLTLCSISDVTAVVFQGRRHCYEGCSWTPIAFPSYLFKTLQIPEVIITNAAGGIHEDLHPGDMMLLNDHINLLGEQPLMGPHNDFFGPRFPDMSEVYALSVRNKIKKASEMAGVPIKEGVYAACKGPAYETPAEVRMLRTLGADAVGMSTVPSAMLCKAAGIKVAGLSCITNYAAGITDSPLSHDEVIEITQNSLSRIGKLFDSYFQLVKEEQGNS